MPVPVKESTKTLLIVDDEELVRDYLRFILEKSGYRVIVAENGEKGVSSFIEHVDISLVITDLHMPRKNGKEFFEDISKIRAGTKILFMSGNAGSLIEWIENEKLEFISKPFKARDILGKIGDVLDGQRDGIS